jgi:hypothetical protein
MPSFPEIAGAGPVRGIVSDEGPRERNEARKNMTTIANNLNIRKTRPDLIPGSDMNESFQA